MFFDQWSVGVGRAFAAIAVVRIFGMMIQTVGCDPSKLNAIDSNVFHYEWRLPIVKLGEVDSYFGVSVAQHGDMDNNTVLLVGAPLNKQPSTNNSAGTLFRCPLSDNSHDCTNVKLDSNEYTNLTEEKNGEWMGATVRSGGIGKNVIVCAPRHIKTFNKERYGMGRCLMLNADLDRTSAKDVMGCSNTCQLGMSAAIVNDRMMVIGAPSASVGKGSAIMFEKRSETNARTEYTTRDTKLSTTMYMGMSVAMGNFFGEEILAYAVGAPGTDRRSNGSVILYEFLRETREHKLRQIIRCKEFGSNFGADVVAADVNGDGWADLVIGAPQYMDRHNEQVGGAVFVFVNRPEQSEKYRFSSKEKLRLVGKSQSHFGMAIANLGDISDDQHDDIAVGAPYEGNGVVYIYLGSDAGLAAEPSQTIQSMHLPYIMQPPRGPIRTFGHSLSGGIDLDQNGYADLIIGAYQSDAVIALMARPKLKVKSTLNAQPVDPKSDKRCNLEKIDFLCFNIQICSWFNKTRNIPAVNYAMNYSIEADTFDKSYQKSRVFFSNHQVSLDRTVGLSTNEHKVCSNETVYLKQNVDDVRSPIMFRLMYRLAEPIKGDSLKPLNPIFDPKKMVHLHSVQFKSYCNDNVSECDAEMEVLSVNMDNDARKESNDAPRYILDVHSELQIHIRLTNHRNAAYEAKLRIEHDANLQFISSDGRCISSTSTRTTCDLGNPILSTANVSILFDPSKLQPTLTVLNITTETTTEQKTPPKPFIFSIRIDRDVKLQARGRSRPEQIDLSNVTETETTKVQFLEDIGPVVKHVYNIINKVGPSSAKDLKVTIDWPSKYEEDRWLLYLEDRPAVIDADGNRIGDCDTSEPANALNLKLREKNPNEDDSNDIEEPWIDELEVVEVDISKVSKRSIAMDPDRDLINTTKSSKILSAKDATTVKSITITCSILSVAKGEQISIHVTSRLSAETALQINQEFRIESSFKLWTDDDIALHVQTQIIPRHLDESISIWWILLAIFIGALCIALIAFGLSRWGFFKRTRVDPVLMKETVEKAKEVRQSIQFRTSNMGRPSMQPRYSMLQRMSFKPDAPVPPPILKNRLRYSAVLEH